MEFSKWMNIIQKTSGRTLGKGEQPTWNPQLYTRIIKERELFIIPHPNFLCDSKAGVVENGTFYALEEVETGKVVPQFMRDFETAVAGWW
jgi:hypothetical protein